MSSASDKAGVGTPNPTTSKTTALAASPSPSFAPMVAGASGGTVSTILLLPLDNLKVRLQVNEGSSSSGTGGNTARPASTTVGTLSSSSSSSSPSLSPSSPSQTQRIGPMRMLRFVVRHEGIAGLYQGLVPAVVGNAASWGGFFFMYESLKQRLRRYKADRQVAQGGETTSSSVNAMSTNANVHINGSEIEQLPALNSWENFQVATVSGAALVFMTNPIWLVKVRMQLQMKRASEQLHTNKVTQYGGFVDAIRTIVRKEGFWALYKGTGPALLLTSHGGVQFVMYEFLRKHFHFARAQRSQDASVWHRFENSLGYLTMGAASKIVASTVTYPLQVVKSRMQQPSSFVELTSTGDVRVVERHYSGLVATVGRIWKKEGIVGFFKGAIPNAIRVAPSAAVTFVVYESIMDFLTPQG